VASKLGQAELDSAVDISVAPDQPPLGLELERAPLNVENPGRLVEADGPVRLLLLAGRRVYVARRLLPPW